MTSNYLPVGESYLEYKKRVLDSKSRSFCGAKWYYATIWLNTGQTTACHHPLPHQVDAVEVTKNYKLLSNTPQKQIERQQMISGERPSGCDYCWRIEDLAEDNVSDRVHKSLAYTEQDLQQAFEAESKQDFPLKYLELSFDRTCNFACSYCNPAFSTTWAKDIKKNGPYTNIGNDGQQHYGHSHEQAGLYDEQKNPYIKAFFDWWDAELYKTVTTLRITGGEPLMHTHVWKIMDLLKEQSNSVKYFAVNTNLIAKDDLIDKLIDKSKGINNFHIYTSNECVGDKAEYLRDGLDWKTWCKNLDKIIDSKTFAGVSIMCTINALSIDGLIEFLDYVIDIKKRGDLSFPTLSLNILRFPNFQSLDVLPPNTKLKYGDLLEKWLESNQIYLNGMEKSNVKRLIIYLKDISPKSQSHLKNNFVNFYKQYDERRGKNLSKTFPDIGEWYNGV